MYIANGKTVLGNAAFQNLNFVKKQTENPKVFLQSLLRVPHYYPYYPMHPTAHTIPNLWSRLYQPWIVPRYSWNGFHGQWGKRVVPLYWRYPNIQQMQQPQEHD